jgi:hypothetical protein
MSALDFDDAASDNGGSLSSDIFDDDCDDVNPDLDDIDNDDVAISNRTSINSNKIGDYVECRMNDFQCSTNYADTKLLTMAKEEIPIVLDRVREIMQTDTLIWFWMRKFRITGTGAIVALRFYARTYFSTNRRTEDTEMDDNGNVQRVSNAWSDC